MRNERERSAWRRENDPAYREAVARGVQRLQAEKLAYTAAVKMEAGCADCPPGTVWPAVALDFDHRPSEEKHANISTLVRQGGWDRLVAEIEKCEVVCANHHRMRTMARLNAAEVSDE